LTGLYVAKILVFARLGPHREVMGRNA
jgi:hypothetical protein